MPRLVIQISGVVNAATEEAALELPDLIIRNLMNGDAPDLELMARLSKISDPKALTAVQDGPIIGYEFVSDKFSFVDVYLRQQDTGTSITIDYFQRIPTNTLHQQYAHFQ